MCEREKRKRIYERIMADPVKKAEYAKKSAERKRKSRAKLKEERGYSEKRRKYVPISELSEEAAEIRRAKQRLRTRRNREKKRNMG